MIGRVTPIAEGIGALILEWKRKNPGIANIGKITMSSELCRKLGAELGCNIGAKIRRLRPGESLMIMGAVFEISDNGPELAIGRFR